MTTRSLRLSIRLGEVTCDRAAEIKAKVEAPNHAAICGHAWEPETARWVAQQQRHDTDLYDKLAAADLLPKREAAAHKTLAPFIDDYIESRVDVKPNTRDHLKRCRNNLVDYFRADRRIDSITPGDADDFRRHLRMTMHQSRCTPLSQKR